MHGKTLIIDSLNILAGARFSKDIIRRGEEYSFIEMCLYLPENELSIDGNIIISREIHTNGRNLCKINGRMVTVNELKKFMENIIDIHGQYDNQTLMNVNTHINLLDEYAGEKLKNLKIKYINLFKEYKQIQEKIKKNYGDEKEKQRKLDLLKYQLTEIESAKLKIKEDIELDTKRKIMLSSEKVAENLEIANIEIGEKCIDCLNNSIKAIEKIADVDKEYKNILTSLKNMYYELQETARQINENKECTFFDENERNEIEERLDTIFSLKRKYGNSIEEILDYKEDIKNEIKRIENLEEYMEILKKEKQQKENDMYKICTEITQERTTFAKKISNEVNIQLRDLEMKNVVFETKIDSIENFNENGLDNVEFLICTNVGDCYKSLAKIASGGEMARIMLAIKSVLADVDKVPILVFDEIDTGISGIAAKAVANKLKVISKSHQVLCVTHLATIAAQGNYNYYISKSVLKNQTKTSIDLLSEEETIREIARIASGEISEITLKHAEELRKAG